VSSISFYGPRSIHVDEERLGKTLAKDKNKEKSWKTSAKSEESLRIKWTIHN
jgi:hypothetical protein